MRCPACHADNPRDAERCGACNAPLPPRRQRRRGLTAEPGTPFAARTEASNRAALRAYRVSLLGLVPFLGLVLGPAALLMGGLARRKGRADPAFTAKGPATAAVVLGGLITVTNWLGLTLAILGLWSRGGP
jgi:hypothetical protein